MNLNLAVISGDGIGPEIIAEGVKVLDAVGAKYDTTFSYTEALIGGCAIDATGTALPDETLRVAESSDAVLLAAVSVLVLLTRLHYAPVLAQLAALQLDNQASAAINDAVQDTLTAEEITYDKLVELEKDTQGNVTAVRSNVAGLNRFRTALTARIDENLADLSVEELGIPVGSVVLPELFSGMGPRLVVRVLAVRTSDAAFRNRFSTVGINQTLHQIFIDIHVTVTILSLAGTQELAVDVTVLAAETVIVGNVPSTYIGLGGPEEEGT